MPVIPFTDLSLSKLSAKKQTRYLCAGLPGFGILVGKRKKTFFVMHGNERRIEMLGKYPAITLKAARLKAVTIIDGTVGIVAAQDPEERIKEYIKQLDASARYKYEQNRLLRRHLLPKVSNLTKTTKVEILKITDKLSGTPSEQLHAHRAIRAFYNWCVLRDYTKTTPLAGLEAPGSDRTRDRVLTDAELKEAWQRAGRLGPYGLVIRLCVLLGTRKSETSAIDKQWITENLTLPGEVTKNGRTHVLPLTVAARHYADKFAGGTRPNWNSWNKMKKNAGLDWLRLHDLRRTMATRAAMLGIAPHIIERILNHVSSGEITPLAQIYNRYKYLPEIKEAFGKYEAHLEEIIGEPLCSTALTPPFAIMANSTFPTASPSEG
ncbi:integrase family protein [Bradyrhizobium sp. CCGUVB1N3]|uniref:tyrosine-type recombinase/integrase n=1 Tax=Bradyrhizobium sp. CCGUVB1N3 TaxID=2949629 RepID=UPI0020B25A08|nr:integrase family protein [Bradyrhizobium sp. CCGUVB1N3]MCP3475076.1 integrase family protein [Bradyrhizobium sp. CCGUVB1N3]